MELPSDPPADDLEKPDQSGEAGGGDTTEGLPTSTPDGATGEEADGAVDQLAPDHATFDPCVTPSATATMAPTMTPTSTPTPTQGVARLPSTGQGDPGVGDSAPRIILLAAAGLVLLATAVISVRRKPG